MSGIRALPPNLQEIANKELGEEPGRIEKDLEHIKEWLKKQPHLTTRTDDQFLITFLRGCKFSLERTKEKIDSYYTMRTALPDFFSVRDPMEPQIQEALSLGIFIPLPGTDDQGRTVIIQRSGVYDPERIHFDTIFRMSFMFWDILLREDDQGMVKGFTVLQDLQKVTLGHLKQMQPTVVKKVMTCFQDAYPIRMKGMNFIHLPAHFDTVMNLFKTFMKEKLKRRLLIHGEDMESLYKHIPKRVLPPEYGGEGPPLDAIIVGWKKKVESYRDYFLEDAKFVSNEKKRPGKPKTHEDLFGLEGSFRQLSFD